MYWLISGKFGISKFVVNVAEGTLVESRSGSGRRFGDHGVAEVGCSGGGWNSMARGGITCRWRGGGARRIRMQAAGRCRTTTQGASTTTTSLGTKASWARWQTMRWGRTICTQCRYLRRLTIRWWILSSSLWSCCYSSCNTSTLVKPVVGITQDKSHLRWKPNLGTKKVSLNRRMTKRINLPTDARNLSKLVHDVTMPQCHLIDHVHMCSFCHDHLHRIGERKALTEHA
jgi:hypothetical protein